MTRDGSAENASLCGRGSHHGMNNDTPPASVDNPAPFLLLDTAALQARAALRRQLRQRRRALGAAAQQQGALAVARQLTRDSLFRRSRVIAFYLPNDGELSLLPLLERSWRMHKRCYLPVIMPDQHLRFAPFEPGDALAANVFGIPEPMRPRFQLIDAKQLDLVLMPLVGFDGAGNRLGMGGGFYDRTLGFLRHRRHWRKPRLLGIAHEFQHVPALPAQPWDVPLDGIVTECRFHSMAR